MPANTSLNVLNLDFETYKADLITYLKSQDRFKDYDFVGSNMNILMDILSYNTFKNGFWTNMAIAEGFNDSAQLLNSVRSHAKELNYTPRSATSAKARVTCTFTASGVSQPYVIQKGSSFSSIVKNNSLVFSMPDTITVASANSSFEFTTDLYEGIYVKDSYVFQADASSVQPSYPITNAKIDTDSLTVTVFEDGSVLGQTFSKAESLLDLDKFSKVFFLQTSATSGNYEVLFGDGNLGYQPKNGATVLFDYRVTNDTQGNGAGSFTINFDPTGGTNELISGVSVSTVQNAVGGAPTETLETTRFYAPRYFQTQERCVTARDYEIALKTKFPEINAVSAFGGEKLSPPQYGKVVIAIDLTNIQGLPDSRIGDYTTFIRGRNPLTITPIFIAADQTYIGVETIVRYNTNVTSESKERLKTLVVAAIDRYNNTELDDFNITFRYSKFTQTIDNADPSILSNITKITLYKKILPELNTPTSITINYNVPLLGDLSQSGTSHDIDSEKCLTSSSFSFNGTLSELEDDGNGHVRIVSTQGNQLVQAAVVGTIDYATGLVQLSNFKIDSYAEDALKIFVRPADNDVYVTQGTILSIESDQVDPEIQAIAA